MVQLDSKAHVCFSGETRKRTEGKWQPVTAPCFSTNGRQKLTRLANHRDSLTLVPTSPVHSGPHETRLWLYSQIKPQNRASHHLFSLPCSLPNQSKLEKWRHFKISLNYYTDYIFHHIYFYRHVIVYMCAHSFYSTHGWVRGQPARVSLPFYSVDPW